MLAITIIVIISNITLLFISGFHLNRETYCCYIGVGQAHKNKLNNNRKFTNALYSMESKHIQQKNSFKFTTTLARGKMNSKSHVDLSNYTFFLCVLLYVARIWFNSDDTPFKNTSIVKSLPKIIN